MTLARQLIEELQEIVNDHPNATVTLVIEDDNGGQSVCSGDFSVDRAELNLGEIMLVGEDDK